MKFKLTIFFLLLSSLQFLKAQDKNTLCQSFLIKGKVQNNEHTLSLRIQVTGYFQNESQTIPIQRDGTFSQNIPVEGMQDIYLGLNKDAITV